MIPYQIGDRISIAETPKASGYAALLLHTATVRFVGEIPDWPNVTAYGIEWDDPLRGKNDGSINGIYYFSAANPTSGSFIKSSNKKILTRTNFQEALDRTYRAPGQVGEDAEIRFGTKVVEKLGFGKLSLIQAHHENLTTVSLNGMQIHSIGDLSQIVPNAETLDLSYNLFTDLGGVLGSVAGLKNLRTLNLNGNVFGGKGSIEMVPPLSSLSIPSAKKSLVAVLENLFLAATRVSVNHINYTIRTHKSLKHLVLSSNGISDEQFRSIDFRGSSLESLSLSFNELVHVDFTHLNPQLASIDLSGNNISQITQLKVPDGCPLDSLDLRGNQISSWAEVDQLPLKFPRLHSLRLNDNPLCDLAETYHLHLLGRLGFFDANQLAVDGTRVSSDEMENAEFWFVSQLKQNKIPDFDMTGGRFHELCAKYSLDSSQLGTQPDTVEQPHMNKSLINFLIRLPSIAGASERILKKKMFQSQNVLRLKGYISAETGLSVFGFKLFYSLQLKNTRNNTSSVKRMELDEWFKALGSWGLDKHPSVCVEICQE
ncbi:hypothetical protein BABINDRAFT_166928 [Babjeviella inositovora NRRL Y-12698]|uniref:CAP-Gly domain-containing protein n=1 Tax=Babjeviella inositovora NRRL Y-12698 TaxID=984486 RepID=A0A1E3QSB2_9ASCO|nr:uncharacterized protein BABINDRAFT_166928 [Babjeviella inositovora NRRL Y-12698]ODQ79827.1 hypothetical protein BABINDRAFT_166928 [Babjeviella inositovora NRRL Y-12698]